MSGKTSKIRLKTAEQVELIRNSCTLLANTLALVASELKEGKNGLQLDKLAEEFIRDHGAVPSFKGYRGFPASVCVSPNEDVVHGIPNAKAFKSGDIISVDLGVFLNGFHGDSAYTFALGDVSADKIKLMEVTKHSLYLGIENAIDGNKVGVISNAIQDYCERKNPYRCVRELVGHGVGFEIHEEPQVPNYGKQNEGPVLTEYTVIAIEPMVNLGRKDVYTKRDNWTIATQDHKASAHFEHTVCVRKDKADVLSTFAPIEEAIKANSQLKFV